MRFLRNVVLPLLAAGVMSSSVYAAPVTSWDLRIELGFIDWTGTDGLSSSIGWAEDYSSLNYSGPLPGGATWAPQRLSWGGAVKSAIGVNTDDSAACRDDFECNIVRTGIETDGAAVDTASFYHENNAISGDSIPLRTASLLTQLWLSPSGGLEVFVGSLAFNINFLETANDGNCFSGSISDCDDIFVLSGINFDTTAGAVVRDFDFGGYSYRTFIGITGLGPLTDEVCSLAGAAVGCIGFTTPENQTSTLQSSFRISALTQDIPVPSTLLLFSMGLLGLRRNNRVAY
jgi:hypothetical protein